MQYNIMNVQHPEFNDCPIEFTKANAYIAHYIYQSEETYINRKFRLPRDDATTFRNKEENIHNRYNDVDNMNLVNKYLEPIKRYLNFIKIRQL